MYIVLLEGFVKNKNTYYSSMLERGGALKHHASSCWCTSPSSQGWGGKASIPFTSCKSPPMISNSREEGNKRRHMGIATLLHRQLKNISPTCSSATWCRPSSWSIKSWNLLHVLWVKVCRTSQRRSSVCSMLGPPLAQKILLHYYWLGWSPWDVSSKNLASVL